MGTGGDGGGVGGGPPAEGFLSWESALWLAMRSPVRSSGSRSSLSRSFPTRIPFILSVSGLTSSSELSESSVGLTSQTERGFTSNSLAMAVSSAGKSSKVSVAVPLGPPTLRCVEGSCCDSVSERSDVESSQSTLPFMEGGASGVGLLSFNFGTELLETLTGSSTRRIMLTENWWSGSLRMSRSPSRIWAF